MDVWTRDLVDYANGCGAHPYLAEVRTFDRSKLKRHFGAAFALRHNRRARELMYGEHYKDEHRQPTFNDWYHVRVEFRFNNTGRDRKKFNSALRYLY